MSYVLVGSCCLFWQVLWIFKDNKFLYVILVVMRNINKIVIFVQIFIKCCVSIVDMYGYDYCNSLIMYEFSRKFCYIVNIILMCEVFLSNGVLCEVVLVCIFIRSVSVRVCCVKLCCVKLCNVLVSFVVMCCVVLCCVSLCSGFLFVV